MKHSPIKMEFFGETCTSLEIFSEFFGEGRRWDDGSGIMVHGCSASFHASKLRAWVRIKG